MSNQGKITLGTQQSRFKEIDHPTVYSNMMGIGLTPFDVTISFGEIANATTSEVIGIPRVKVILAPEQAANLVQMLTATLKAFVDGNGKLRQGGRITQEVLDEAIRAGGANEGRPETIRDGGEQASDNPSDAPH